MGPTDYLSAPEETQRLPIPDWPRWKFINCWRKYDLFGNRGWTFSVFNCWFNGQFCGFVLFNIGVEYNRKAS